MSSTDSKPGADTVLIVEDSKAMRSYLRTALEEAVGGLEILEASNGLSGFQSILEHKPQLVLCDLQMPQFDGLKLLRMWATREEVADIPIIVLTADQDTERKVEVLEAGAADYITKPFHKKELAARVKVHLRIKSLTDDLRRANAKLETLAKMDALTGLGNRLFFNQVLSEELQRTARYESPLSMLLMDVDHFKKVNDTYGHLMGDEVLRGVGRTLSAGVRTTDRATRYGGEEFAVLLPHTDAKNAFLAGERLRRKVESQRHYHEGASVKVTVSVGVSTVRGPDVAPDDFTARADEALYAAKRRGRNRVVLESTED